MVRPGRGDARPALRGCGQLVGVTDPSGGQPDGRLRGIRGDCGPGGDHGRPKLADRGEPPRQRNLDRGRARADRIGRGFDPGLGRSDDRVQPRSHGHAHRARVAGRAADRAGLLQRLRLAHGGDREPPSALVGNRLSRGDRGGVRGLRTTERVQPMLSAAGQPATDDERVADTPFAGIPSRPASHGLSRGERWNVVFVLAVSQTVQVGIVAVMTAGVFFVLGLILLSPQLLAEWTRNGSSYGQILGMTFPVPQALIQTSLFLGALTFMYLSARAAGDADYRKRFLDPLIDDPKVVFSTAAEFGSSNCAGHWRHRHRGRLPSLPAHALSLAPRNTCASMWWKGAVSQRSKKFL